ncbi:alpha/beta fold hydrolase [Actinophytocola gossypii]|uniref:alpha/beta fold hydrolase n=1 Tax=Actinophytocola gossypii TaxID=2812003 RepID=UPI0028831540|nr:alpha/beta hydrolase [Actinophytocola gossypii]
MFEIPLAAVGVRTLAPTPVPGPRLADAHLAAVDAAAAVEPVLVGGVSFGAHLAAEWALRNPGRCAGLVLALPAWNGEPEDAPAALSARASAADVRRRGVDGALTDVAASAPAWLAEELARAWPGYGDGLAGSLELAAGRAAPTPDGLAALRVPVGIAACVDDPVHPVGVAEAWARALPHAAVRTTRLAVVGRDPEALGRAAVLAWLHAGGRPG